VGKILSFRISDADAEHQNQSYELIALHELVHTSHFDIRIRIIRITVLWLSGQSLMIETWRTTVKRPEIGTIGRRFPSRW